MYILADVLLKDKMRILIACLLMMLSALSANAQKDPIQLGPTGSDCMGALLINDTVVGPVYSPKGFGKKLEIKDYELGDPYFIQREHNTVWYKFNVPYDAIFTFDLIPNRKDDDFDFLIFQYDGPNFCRDIADGKKIPIRTNISRKNIEVEGKTGLSESSVHEYVPSGPGSSYSKALKVKRGQMYYILVDNPFRENDGHTLYLHFKKLNPTDKKSKKQEEEKYEIPIRKLHIEVTDEETGAPIASNIFVDGLPDSIPHRYPAISKLDLDVVSYRNYTINVVKKGYLFKSEKFIAKNDSLYNVNISLKPLTEGARVNLENIKFASDETTILEKSLPALDQLHDFLEINPDIHIEIQGHVNGESKRNKRKYRKLSQRRAKAIYKKLVDAGIDKSRMDYKGFGNAKMIYPTPINNRQAEANRRVEIEITRL